MWNRLKWGWTQFTHWPPGQRFVRFYERHQRRRSNAHALLYPIATMIAFAIGILLLFLPGPAIVFFVLAACLAAMHSRWFALRMDQAELKLRALARSRRHKGTP
jgi:hypothetical protein